MQKKDFFASLGAGLGLGLLSALIIRSLSAESGILQSFSVNWISLAMIVFGLICVGLGFAKIIGRKIPIIYEAAKFVVVGGLNTLVDFGVLNVLLLAAHVSAGPLFSVFKGISFIVAVANSYVWNNFWTFTSSQKTDAKKVIKFFAVSIVGFGVNVGIASIIVNLIPPAFGITPQLWANVAALAATIASMVWNFIGYRIFVFHTLDKSKKGEYAATVSE